MSLTGHSYNRKDTLANTTNSGDVPATGGSGNNSAVLIVKPDGSGYETKFGLTGITAIPPIGLPFAFPNIDFGPSLGDRVPNTPIIYSIIDNGVQNTVTFVNSVSTLFLIKNGIRSTVTSYVANLGEIVIVYEDINGDIVLQPIDTNKNTGWWNITDTTFIPTNPQTIPANTRTKLIINSDNVIETYSPNGLPVSDIYDDITNKITPLLNGDSYIFRLSLTANPTLNNRNFTIDLDIGGTQGIVFQRSTRLARGAGNDTQISVTNSIFTLNTFVANGGELYITCDGEVDLTDISLFIQKITSA